MDKKKNYSIKEVSQLLNIPKATIRYWDSEGLISTGRNPQNDYREFSLAVAMELGNISFFRNIDIPVKELKRMLHSDISVQEELLVDASRRLERKMEELARQADRIRMQRLALEEIRRLKESEPQPAIPEFTRVIAFSDLKERHWHRIIENPGDFVLVFPEGSVTDYRYGIGCREEERKEDGEELLWERMGTEYQESLLIADTQNESRNNLHQQRSRIGQSGKSSGCVVAKYLASGVRGQEDVWDYYKMWVEIK